MTLSGLVGSNLTAISRAPPSPSIHDALLALLLKLFCLRLFCRREEERRDVCGEEMMADFLAWNLVAVRHPAYTVHPSDTSDTARSRG